MAAPGKAVLREDADFHPYQALEAAWRQYGEVGWQILVGTARYITAHSPMPRAMLRTAEGAHRLYRNEALYEEGPG